MSGTADLSRRKFLLATVATAVIPENLLRAATPDREGLAIQAVIWGLPVVLTGRYEASWKKQGLAMNCFYLGSKPSTPDVVIIGPNVNVIYGLVWFDLRQEPQVVSVPDCGGLYYSMQVQTPFMDTFGYIGSHTTGTGAGAFLISGPGWDGKVPQGVTHIKSPTHVSFAVTRTLVAGDHEDALGKAQQLQRGFGLSPLSTYGKAAPLPPVVQNEALRFPPLDLKSAGAGFFDELCAGLKVYGVQPEDEAELHRYRVLGITPGAKPSTDTRLAAIFAKAVPSAITTIESKNFFFRKDGSWMWDPDANGSALHNPLLRAAINVYGPGWHLAQECLYFMSFDSSDGHPLSGDHRYKITFTPGQTPPVDVYWSITVYDANIRLVRNPINRYAIYTYTDGLRFNADGSLDIHVQSEPPEEGVSNWLPCPSSGKFLLHSRTYGPRPQILNGTYKLPPIQPV